MFTDHHFSQPVATCHRTDSFLLVWSHWGDCWCPEPRGSFSNGSLSRQTINTNDSSSPSPSFFPPFLSQTLAFSPTCLRLTGGPFLYAFIFLLPAVFTLYPPLLLSVWHQRAGTLWGVVVWRGQLTPPTPLQSMCITIKHNGKPCECHQYARGDVVILQTIWSINF